MKFERRELAYYGMFILMSMLLSFGLYSLEKKLRIINFNNLNLLGITLNFTVLPKYITGLLQWVLILTLFNKDHALSSLIHKGTWFVLAIVVCDSISVIMIKKHSYEWIGWELHCFFDGSIRVIADTYAMIIAVLLHKFFKHQ